MTKGRNHFWQGEWIDDAELEKRVLELDSWISPELEKEPRLEPLLQACDRMAKELVSNSSSGAIRDLKNSLDEDSRAGLKEVADALRRDVLETKLKRELGTPRPIVDARIGYDDTVFETWSPLGFLTHISPQNSFAVGPMSVLEGLLSGNLNFLKTGKNESLFPQLFLSALCSFDRTGWIARRVIVARISSERQDLLQKIFQQSDGIAAWGGEESIETIKKSAPSGGRVIEWGHKISFIYVTDPSKRDEKLFERIARECCDLEQRACSSPQCIYVDTDDWKELERFADRLATTLERVSPKIPRSPDPADSEWAEISMVTECHRLEACYGKAKVIEAKDGSWRLLLDQRSPLQASPLFRTVWIKPLPSSKIVSVLRPMRKYLQTAGLECHLSEAYSLCQKLRAAGVDRVRRVGEMLRSYSGEPHDGVYALQRYCRRTSVQLATDAADLSSFQDLRAAEPRILGPDTKVTPKEKFTDQTSDPARAKFFFKSGGSTGDPKLSTYDYDQYYEQMRLGADGLVAAGFDPIQDRPINLFFSGSLYGGFLSIFSTLEMLEAVQFPMAAQEDMAMVAQTIIKNRIDTLLGMPSYIMRLFENQNAALKTYGGVKKIFYGGEHFSEAQQRFLKEKCGIELIRSLAYGSVDIGAIGYQCRFCEGSVHHLHHGLHTLEILKTDSDSPVTGDEIGRLVITPQSGTSNKPMRYEIGDVGQWVGKPGEPCSCGRMAPRFKLLGRMGDIFRIGATFFNYQKFSQILSNRESYTGAIQIVLETDGLKEKLTLKISSTESLSPERCHKICLEEYSDLAEGVLKDKTLLFEVGALVPEKFEKTKGSGKLIRIIDRRVRA